MHFWKDHTHNHVLNRRKDISLEPNTNCHIIHVCTLCYNKQNRKVESHIFHFILLLNWIEMRIETSSFKISIQFSLV